MEMSSTGLVKPRQPYLLIRGSGRLDKVVLGGAELTIGRSVDCDLVLSDIRISRMHARIIEEQGNYFILDAGSRHGTLVSGTRCSRARLERNDQVSFGVRDCTVSSLEHG